MKHTDSLEAYFITHFTGHFDSWTLEPAKQELLKKIVQDAETLWLWFHKGDEETCAFGGLMKDDDLHEAMRANVDLDAIWRACKKHTETE